MVALLALLATACATTVDDLKPGVARGTMESGFIKTTEGLELEVRGRSYDGVWAAVERAVASARTKEVSLFRMGAPLMVVDHSRDRGIIRTEERGHPYIGPPRAYVRVFVSPRRPGADLYVVEVSRIMKWRGGLVEGRDWERDLLRAIAEHLRTPQ